MATGFYSSAGGWATIHSYTVSSANVSINISAWSHYRYFAHQDVQLAFDNFIINQGQLTCPGYMLSGRVSDSQGNPIPGVTVSSGTAGSATTDYSGAYALTGLAAGTYILTPSKSGYTLSPASRTVTVPPTATGQDFTAIPITYSVEGKVTDSNGAALADVSISDGSGHTSPTSADGKYVLTGLLPGTHTITPSKSGYISHPPRSCHRAARCDGTDSRCTRVGWPFDFVRPLPASRPGVANHPRRDCPPLLRGPRRDGPAGAPRDGVFCSDREWHKR